MVRFTTAGESHGPCLTVIVEGIPAGVEITADMVNEDLDQGYFIVVGSIHIESILDLTREVEAVMDCYYFHVVGKE